MDFVDKVKGFLLEPSNTLYNSREDPLIEALKYYFILVLIYSVLEALIRIFFGELIVSMMGKYVMFSGLPPNFAGMEEIIIESIYYIIYAIPGIFISGVFLHFGVYLAGGKKGLNQTIKALVYTSTPSLLLGWIPVINIVAGMWSLVLNIIGIREFHEISTERAILAMLIPLTIILLLAAILIVAILFLWIKIPLG